MRCKLKYEHREYTAVLEKIPDKGDKVILDGTTYKVREVILDCRTVKGVIISTYIIELGLLI